MTFMVKTRRSPRLSKERRNCLVWMQVCSWPVALRVICWRCCPTVIEVTNTSPEPAPTVIFQKAAAVPCLQVSSPNLLRTIRTVQLLLRRLKKTSNLMIFITPEHVFSAWRTRFTGNHFPCPIWKTPQNLVNAAGLPCTWMAQEFLTRL